MGIYTPRFRVQNILAYYYNRLDSGYQDRLHLELAGYWARGIGLILYYHLFI